MVNPGGAGRTRVTAQVAGAMGQLPIEHYLRLLKHHIGLVLGVWLLVTGATIVVAQLLPNVLNHIIVYASGLVGVAMIIAASLSFLGLGSSPPAPEWGFMLNSLRGSIYVVPYVAALPGLFIGLTSVAFNAASDALRESMDTRLS